VGDGDGAGGVRDGEARLSPCASPYMPPLGTHSIHVTGEALTENVGGHVFGEGGPCVGPFMWFCMQRDPQSLDNERRRMMSRACCAGLLGLRGEVDPSPPLPYSRADEHRRLIRGASALSHRGCRHSPLYIVARRSRILPGQRVGVDNMSRACCAGLISFYAAVSAVLG